MVPYVLANLVLTATVRAVEHKGWTWWLRAINPHLAAVAPGR